MKPEELAALDTDELILLAVKDASILEDLSPQRLGEIRDRADEILDLLVDNEFHRIIVSQFGAIEP